MIRPMLVVFVRAPVIGGAKTRLSRGIGKVHAWRRYRAMTAAVLRNLTDPRWETVMTLSPEGALHRRFPGVWPDHLPRTLQGHGDLGVRQARMFTTRAPVCVIGSDAPWITRADVALAFDRLKRHDAVIGPAEDGGYWLLALNSPAPRGLFQGIRWSHENTRVDLTRQLELHDLRRIACLRRLCDVDEAADLKRA